jgi:DNA-binding GntR family transcriptional regulator
MPPRTKVEHVIAEITQRIENGTYPPGSQLPLDADLRREFAVSQMTIRTAMERLRHLVESAPGKGRFVKEPPG